MPIPVISSKLYLLLRREPTPALVNSWDVLRHFQLIVDELAKDPVVDKAGKRVRPRHSAYSTSARSSTPSLSSLGHQYFIFSFKIISEFLFPFFWTPWNRKLTRSLCFVLSSRRWCKIARKPWIAWLTLFQTHFLVYLCFLWTMMSPAFSSEKTTTAPSMPLESGSLLS